MHGARCVEGASIRCGHGREFSLYTHGKLVKPAPETVAAVPVFCAELSLHPAPIANLGLFPSAAWARGLLVQG